MTYSNASSIPPAIRAKLAAQSKTFNEAETGSSGSYVESFPTFPNSGTRDVHFNKLNVDWNAKFKYNTAKTGGQAKELDAYSIQFRYKAVNDDGKMQMVTGETLVIPYNTEGLPENQMTRVNIALGRLRAQIKGFLNQDEDFLSTISLPEAIEQMLNLANHYGNEGTTVILNVLFRITPNNYISPKTNKEVQGYRGSDIINTNITLQELSQDSAEAEQNGDVG